MKNILFPFLLMILAFHFANAQTDNLNNANLLSSNCVNNSCNYTLSINFNQSNAPVSVVASVITTDTGYEVTNLEPFVFNILSPNNIVIAPQKVIFNQFGNSFNATFELNKIYKNKKGYLKVLFIGSNGNILSKYNLNL